MLKTSNNSMYSGDFSIDGKQLSGDLIFGGRSTTLELYSPIFFRPDATSDHCIHGTLKNLTKVSLLQCITPSTPATTMSRTGRQHSARIFPHYIAYGQEYLAPSDKTIYGLRFLLRDRFSIFQDFDSFSTLIDVSPDTLRSLINKKKRKRVRIGRNPFVSYFTDSGKIFRTRSAFGSISAYHCPTFGFGSSRGASIRNEIEVALDFPKPINFNDAISSLHVILQFFEIIAGRPQPPDRLALRLRRKPGGTPDLEVYQCMQEYRSTDDDDSRLHFIDLPIDAVRESKHFSEVFSQWLSRHEDWKVSRERFSASFSQQSRFSIDRLVGAANMFDVLPASAIPETPALSDEVKKACDECRRIFKSLDAGPERDSMLNSLGRIGQPTLKSKVQYRAKPIVDVMGKRLPHLQMVLDLSIDARNFFVHGGIPKIDFYKKPLDTIPFFTESLEFVFAVSDLIESGWNVHRWLAKGSAVSHPISKYMINYPDYLDELKNIIPDGSQLRRKFESDSPSVRNN